MTARMRLSPQEIELEGHCYSRLRQSEDFAEGVRAFHENAAPHSADAEQNT